MFNVDNNPTFTRTVTVMVPSGDGHEEQSFKTTFEGLSNDEIAAFDFSTSEGTNDFLRRVIISMGDLAGADGTPVAYSHEIRDKVLAKQWARVGLMQTYLNSVNEVAAGN